MAIIREARIEHLPDIVAYVASASRNARPDEEVQFAVRLAVEEVFTNIVRYGYPDGPGPVEVSVATNPRAVTITVRDEGRPFDPTTAPTPDVQSGWEERPLGGLGWHLVRDLVDEIRHRPRRRGGNVVTLVKHLPDGRSNPEQTMELEIEIEAREQASVVIITGSVDGLNAARVHTVLSEQVTEGNIRLVGDLGGLSYTSSAGLRVLLGAVKAARRQGGDLRLAGVTPPVQKVLELSGFTSILQLFESVDAAVASYLD